MIIVSVCAVSEKHSHSEVKPKRYYEARWFFYRITNESLSELAKKVIEKIQKGHVKVEVGIIFEPPFDARITIAEDVSRVELSEEYRALVGEEKKRFLEAIDAIFKAEQKEKEVLKRSREILESLRPSRGNIRGPKISTGQY